MKEETIGCKYCEAYKNDGGMSDNRKFLFRKTLISKPFNLGFTALITSENTIENVLFSSGDDFVIGNIKIKYCPVCGRKL